jgi:LSD1 subclass zinc finger protein
MEGMSLYALLDVERDASDEEIRAAFRTLSQQHHPDHGGSSEYFQQVHEAYGTLGDPDRRRTYDSLFTPLPRAPKRSKTPPPTSTSVPPTSSGETVLLRCANCRRQQSVHRRAARFVCAGCEVAYRFARCPQCKKSAQIKESLTNWTCSNCQLTSISEWMTLERMKCDVCTTLVSYPRGVKRFSCLKCATRYVRCPKCDDCVSPKADIGKKKVKCPHCRKRIAV